MNSLNFSQTNLFKNQPDSPMSKEVGQEMFELDNRLRSLRHRQSFSLYKSKVRNGIYLCEQTLIAVREVSKEVLRNKQDFFPIEPMDYTKVLVISLGTGVSKRSQKYTAEMAAKWGVMGWLTQKNSTPIIDIFQEAGTDLVDYFLAVFFKALHSQDNYLRIQAENLTGDASSVDVTTEENLNRLLQIGQGLLQAPVSRINLVNGNFEPVPGGGTNKQALIRFAEMLSDEQKFRKLRSEEKK